jgi:hypothetical protein
VLALVELDRPKDTRTFAAFLPFCASVPLSRTLRQPFAGELRRGAELAFQYGFRREFGEIRCHADTAVVAYRAVPTKAAYVEPVAVGDELPSLPIFRTEED